MKIKTSELAGAVLDWAVSKCEGFNAEALVALAKRVPGKQCGVFLTKYSTDWAQGGPIIEREGLELSVHIIHNGVITGWACEKDWPSTYQKGATGPTPLIAAMRCYVASKLGDEVDVPDELINN